MGLSGEHHGELNKQGVTRKRFAQLRKQYARDPVALQQLDMYDPRSEYQVWWRKLRDALRTGDEKQEREAAEWLKRNYPDV